ncbi:MAG: helix-turn-helix domain-containing protein [Myxococcales bacterium FL481]|nr:MAG: helix-turn-helix domain-containing protein [Myxococcales bacterium FL481]
MDSAVSFAARALMAGKPLEALDQVALRDDAPALALRGAAMAQLGELPRARVLLRRAVGAFSAAERLARARAELALAEVAFALREFSVLEGLPGTIAELEARGDRGNASHARLLRSRYLVLCGRLADARSELDRTPADHAHPLARAIYGLTQAELSIRAVAARRAQHELDAALAAAEALGVHALGAEIRRLRAGLYQPAARRWVVDHAVDADLFAVEEALNSPAVVVNACRREVWYRGACGSFVRRPVLFELLVALAKRWPHVVAREELLAAVFGGDERNESWRERLRVEVGRLRTKFAKFGGIEPVDGGYRLSVPAPREVRLLLPPFDGEHAAVVALLDDGRPWSSTALAEALNLSQRSVQRALAELADEGRVYSLGEARAKRWLIRSSSETTTALLLPQLAGGV